MIRTAPAVALLAILHAIGPAKALAQADPVVARGIQFLKKSSGDPGEMALAALAMIKAEVSPDDPGLARALGIAMQRFATSPYSPGGGNGPDMYEAAVVILAMANHDATAHRREIEAAARFLLSRQNANGSWDYIGRTAGDTSISQYALLGLWEAENAGVPISPTVWDRAASWFLSTQRPNGSWQYHPDEGQPETIGMAAAGVGSLLICDRQLAPYRSPPKVANPLLIPVQTEAERRRYTAEVSPQRIAAAVRAGAGWIGANFSTADSPLIGRTPYYTLYGIERIGALADTATLGKRDWYAEGRRYIETAQKGDGSFAGDFGAVPNTSWAVLFVTRSTAKTIRKLQLRRLGSGTLIGGRGLPKDLGSISIAGGHVVARPMDGAVEGMLAVLEDPRVEDAASALAGLVGRYRDEGPAALRPYEDRFRKLLTDPDPGVRRVAAWSLARAGDPAMALPLIEALRDPDPGVVDEARLGLQLLSRKIDGLGPPPSATPEQKAAAIDRWREWFESTRPPVGTEEPPGPTARRSP